MFSDDEMRYRLRLKRAAARDIELRRLQTRVQHLLLPFERLFEDDVRERVEAGRAAGRRGEWLIPR